MSSRTSLEPSLSAMRRLRIASPEPDEPSEYSKTPDFERLVTDQRVVLLAAAKFGQVLETEPMFTPGVQQVFEAQRKLLDKMAQHDPPSSMFQDGTVRGWFASTAVSWSLWWNSEKLLKPLWLMPAEGWTKVWKVCTEDERARLFRRKEQPLSIVLPNLEIEEETSISLPVGQAASIEELPPCPCMRRRLTLGTTDSDTLPEQECNALASSGGGEEALAALPDRCPELMRQNAFVWDTDEANTDESSGSESDNEA